MKEASKKGAKNTIPIQHWSHSSLVAFLRNPLAWHKRYVEHVYDQPSTPSSIVGRAGHSALEHFYRGEASDVAIAHGLDYIRTIADFEINFGKAKNKKERKAKRASIEREYLQAIGFYLAKPPRHKVLGVEVRGVVEVEGLPLPLKAVSDLVVESRAQAGAVDIVDHKFVDTFSKDGATKTMFILQALFNYYTVQGLFERPVRRFMVYECKKSRNADGSPQLRRYILDFSTLGQEFNLFHRLILDATVELTRKRVYLPNPSDMFEGENSVEIYRLNLLNAEEELSDG